MGKCLLIKLSENLSLLASFYSNNRKGWARTQKNHIFNRLQQRPLTLNFPLKPKKTVSIKFFVKVWGGGGWGQPVINSSLMLLWNCRFTIAPLIIEKLQIHVFYSSLWSLQASLPLVFFPLFLALLCSLVLLHPRVHYLELTSDSSWPPDLAAYTFFGYNVGDLAFLLAKSSLLVKTVKEGSQLGSVL